MNDIKGVDTWDVSDRFYGEMKWRETRCRIIKIFFLTIITIGYIYLAMNGDELKLWRKRWGITQVDLAKMLGTYQVTIARWETGARKISFLLPLALEALENRIKEGK
jgi:DNA-binding XRE family transcriptional regulator